MKLHISFMATPKFINIRTRALTVAVICMITLPTSAFDIAGYRNLSTRANSPKSTEDSLAKLTLTGYHQGIAETLQLMKIHNNGTFTLPDGQAICIPKSASFSPEMIKGLMEGEVQKPEIYRATLGPEWEKTFAFTLVLVSLNRLFPC
jgi:hypothetical protein